MYVGANELDIAVVMGLLKWKALKLTGRAELGLCSCPEWGPRAAPG